MESVNWQNRIVSYGVQKASAFKANPLNWRKHPARQSKALRGSLDTLGWVQPIVANQRTGLIVDGHERVEAALRNGDAEVPFILVDLLPEEEAQALLSLDAIAALAQTDAGKVDELLRLVETDNTDVMQFLSEMAKEAGLDYGQPPEDAPEPQIDRAAELQAIWKTETGQLWEIPSKSGKGVHRLLCGDCTKAEDVARVMQGEKADMVFTDPPYAIFGSSTGVSSDIADDKMVRPFFRDILMLCRNNTKEYAHIYICCDFRSWSSWWEVAKDAKLQVKNCIVWDKQSAGMGSMYRNQHEFIMFLANSYQSTVHMSQTKHGQMLVTDTNVWQIKRELNKEHNAQKPVEAVMRAITNSSKSEESVIEPFSGSGTTIVACERLGRYCRAIEISAPYVAVTLERLSQMGLEPRLM